MAQQYVTLEEAASLLGISVEEMTRRLKADPDFKHFRQIRDGDALLFRRSEINEFARLDTWNPEDEPAAPPIDVTRGQTPEDVQRLSSGAAGAPPNAPSGVPVRIGRYETRRVLGGGTFGRVYLAFDPEIERHVAIKVPLLPPESHREFLREARVVAQLHHPNVCPVYDVGVQDGLPFIVMRYVEGGTLENVLASGLPPPEIALWGAEQIAKGLEAAHARGVFHRDLKPANVLYDAQASELLLTDFGVARWLESSTATTGGIKGTPLYMAPEQWEPGGPFGDISARTDVYALGVLLFQYLTGARLFDGAMFQLMRHHCQTSPRKPSEVNPAIDPRLDALVLKAIAKQPDERYSSAKEFADAIETCLRALVLTPAPPAVVAVPPAPPPAEQQWQITVPGTLYRRRKKDVEWKKVVQTPATITTRTGEVYILSVSSGTTDADLSGLECLKGLFALQGLDFQKCDQLTGDGLEHLKDFSALQWLNFQECERLADTGLEHLKGLTWLRTLSLHGCKQLTDAGVAELQAALPNCKIER